MPATQPETITPRRTDQEQPGQPLDPLRLRGIASWPRRSSCSTTRTTGRHDRPKITLGDQHVARKGSMGHADRVERPTSALVVERLARRDQHRVVGIHRLSCGRAARHDSGDKADRGPSHSEPADAILSLLLVLPRRGNRCVALRPERRAANPSTTTALPLRSPASTAGKTRHALDPQPYRGDAATEPGLDGREDPTTARCVRCAWCGRPGARPRRPGRPETSSADGWAPSSPLRSPASTAGKRSQADLRGRAILRPLRSPASLEAPSARAAGAWCPPSEGPEIGDSTRSGQRPPA